MEIDLYSFNPHLSNSGTKRRRISVHGGADSFSSQSASMDEAILPVLRSSDYFTLPCLNELSAREAVDPGYCSKVPNFTVGRHGFGSVKFLGDTDVRSLDLDKIFKLRRNEVVVYEDEKSKPEVGQGLNKAAVVTLLVKTSMSREWYNDHFKRVTEKLRVLTERQGAQFLSFNSISGEWKFVVQHFSKFGLNESDEEDIMMEDDFSDVQDSVEMNNGDISDFNYVIDSVEPTLLSHSLPAHLKLDPVKMSEMKMMFSPEEDDEEDDFKGKFLHQRQTSGKELSISPLQRSSQLTIHKETPNLIRKTPRALLEYNPGNFSSNTPGSILLSGQEKGVLPRTLQAEGFKLDLKQETPVSNSYSRNIVDAGLFMGRSFRVGWGPNGVLVHSGKLVGSNTSGRSVLSSVITLENVAIDKVVRDENNELREELVDLCFDSPLNLHKEMDHESTDLEVGNFKLKLQKVVCNRLTLPEICRRYMEIVEKRLEVDELSPVSRVLLMHQVMVWELIKVLFSERKSKLLGDDYEEDMLTDGRETSADVDLEAHPLIRRAEFSYWLEESVCHRVQNEISSLNESSYLEHIFLLLTGRQVASAVELAASKGDVRLACLLSQAGGSTINRSDIGQQLEIWRVNGMDFNFIEKNRIRLLQVLSGDILGSLQDVEIDWKRFLGLLMWYQLSPDTSLPVIFRSYEALLIAGKAPYPVPIYIDEAPNEEDPHTNHNPIQRYDLTYYLMLLHSREESKFDSLKPMFSSFSSTNDPLDCHAIWHHRAVLESIGTFSANDLHVLDMGFVSQLLCISQCHWAIYVVLHIPCRDDYPYLHATLIREILFQYCEIWSSNESQRKFIEDLGIPSAWLHEALATYFNYYRDFEKAMDHFIECGNWQKAHVIFVTSVAHSLFLSGEHQKIWQLAVSMEDHKSEIEDWDLGAGLYISFYLLESSLQEEGDAKNEADTLEEKKDACLELIGQLNKSLAVWGSRLVVEARMVYSKMGEEICNMLLCDDGEDSTREVQLSCFETVFKAPIPQDLHTCHLQDALSIFTSFISETAVS